MEFFKPINILLNLLFKLVGSRSAQEKEKTQRVIEYIETCVSHMNKIMEYEQHPIPVIEQSRKFLQNAHYEIAIHLEKVATTVECDIIKKSLMSARVYYHALKDGEVTDEKLMRDYNERYFAYKHHIYDQKIFRQNSYEVFIKELVLTGRKLDKEYLHMEKSKIKEVCQEDIARIYSLKEKLKTRKVHF